MKLDIGARALLGQLIKRSEAKRRHRPEILKPVHGPDNAPSRLPWGAWELDEDFFRALSHWTLDNPETSLDRILEKISVGINASRDLFALIPDRPFPAHSLVTAIAYLFTLGVAVLRATDEVQAFAKSVVQWVMNVKSAFDSTPGGQFSKTAWRNLAHMRELIDEICKWAAARLGDRRWLRIGHGLTIDKEITEFKARITEARRVFMDLSVLNVTTGVDVLKHDLQELRKQELAIVLEIKKIRMCQADQLAHIVSEMDNQKRAAMRHMFLSETLVPHTVENPTYTHQGKQPCDAGTRVDILNDIFGWIYDITDESRNFLWLTGDPGCGKSAITASIARDCKDKHILWAQLFINRKSDNTTKPKLYFPTIARQFADRSPDVQRALHDALVEQPSLIDDIGIDQARKLFVDAIAIACSPDRNSPVVVVIDALDETDRSRLKETATIFPQLFEALRDHPNAKVFISSRTEDDISSPFSRTLGDTRVKHIHLDTSTQSSIDDVGAFLKQRLFQIVQDNNLIWDVWPGDERLKVLVTRASGLFIWAVTAVRFLQQQIDALGAECLNDVLDLLNTEDMADVSTLYSIILHLTYPASSSEWEFEKFRRIVGAIVVLREPLSLAELGDLLDLRQSPTSAPVDIVNFVRRLRTLLAAGTDTITPQTVPRLHKSFFEFITSERVDDRFRIDQEGARVKLGRQPLELPPRLDSFRMYSSKWESARQWLDAHQADVLNYISSQDSLTLGDKTLCTDWAGKPGVIYERATIYIYKLLTADRAGAHAAADQLVELKDCMQTWSTWDAVKAISQYYAVRDRLRAFPVWRGGEDFNKVVALDTDSICARLYLVLYDREQYQRLVCQSEAKMHMVLNLLQGMLDSLSLDNNFRGSFLQALIKMSRETGLYPDGLLQHDVTLCDELDGPGTFRHIWWGTYKGQEVAIKVPSPYAHHTIQETLEQFSGEALLWRQLRHINVLPLLCLFRGYDNHPKIGLVSPWMANGDIQRYLYRNPNADRVSLVRDVAKGLEYLHTMQPSIIHGELTFTNILITDEHRACIADFRLSTGYQSEALGLSLSSVKAEAISLRWMAPELLSGEEHIDCSTSSDVYAFGCVVYSIFSGDLLPHGNNVQVWAVAQEIIDGKRPQRPSQCVPSGALCHSLGLDDHMWGIVEECWRHEPTERPTMSDIIARLPRRRISTT